jgi:hypothetical protein
MKIVNYNKSRLEQRKATQAQPGLATKDSGEFLPSTHP